MTLVIFSILPSPTNLFPAYHCSNGAGVPVATQVNDAASPSFTVLPKGWVVITGITVKSKIKQIYNTIAYLMFNHLFRMYHIL